MNQLSLWNLFQIYLYIRWYKFREKSSSLAWKWFLFQWKLEEEKWSAHNGSEFRIKRNQLFLRYVGWAFWTGGVLAVFISLTMFWQMPYDLWRAFNNLLVIVEVRDPPGNRGNAELSVVSHATDSLAPSVDFDRRVSDIYLSETWAKLLENKI